MHTINYLEHMMCYKVDLYGILKIKQYLKKEGDISYLAYGGDFGDFPNDYDFSGNGLVFANGEVTPKFYEIKYWYADILFEDIKEGLVK